MDNFVGEIKKKLKKNNSKKHLPSSNDININGNKLTDESESQTAADTFQLFTAENWTVMFNPALIPVWIAVIFGVGSILLIAMFRKELIPALTLLTNYVKSMGNSGIAMMTLIVFIPTIPFIPGHYYMVILCGFIFGFPLGLIPSIIGSWIGSIFVFILFRSTISGAYRERFLLKLPQYKVIENAIENDGFKLVFLLRLSNYPTGFAFMSALLAVTSFSTQSYIWGSALAIIIDCIAHVYIGSTINDLTKDSGSPTKSAIMIGTIIIALCVFVYIIWLVRSKLNSSQDLKEGWKYGKQIDYDERPQEIIDSEKMQIPGLAKAKKDLGKAKTIAKFMKAVL